MSIIIETNKSIECKQEEQVKYCQFIAIFSIWLIGIENTIGKRMVKKCDCKIATK